MDNEIRQMFENQSELKRRQRLSHEKMFMSQKHLQKNFTTDADEVKTTAGIVRKGDLVVVLNGFNLPVGPFKVLAFAKVEDGEPAKMYLDWDCYWLPKSIHCIVGINTQL